MTDVVGTADMTNRRVAIVVSRFNESVTLRLVDGAIDALLRHGGERANIDVVWVPGAW
ncbi:MAG: 6,7-dimethyl-8-ribityllumazine synthase, partial [Gemmatimonadaceae bacterium]|nr:6,7-dimethyl-8-ribityllumazine synthase [Gemmatimonadaceae bacterium]